MGESLVISLAGLDPKLEGLDWTSAMTKEKDRKDAMTCREEFHGIIALLPSMPNILRAVRSDNATARQNLSMLCCAYYWSLLNGKYVQCGSFLPS